MKKSAFKEASNSEALSELPKTLENKQNQQPISLGIKWDPAIDRRSRGPYFGNGLSTKYDRTKKAEEKSKGSYKVSDFFFSSSKSNNWFHWRLSRA